ncbi:hypothetical protein CWC39_07990 [Corynebacterium heidelbergense]|uniref:Holin n=1 Tax=Corynebacterium heidelbergense TaxID=2055947 RepID=A0A364VA90_9CORY|nr:hypothetical protein CWC39_07990 [Corynebacterium heidelbergense]
MSNAPAVIRYPWRATLRTTIVAAIALLPLLPEIAEAANIDTVPAVVSFLTVTAAIQRVLAVPGVEKWLRNHTTFLSSTHPADQQADELDYVGKHRKD